MPDYIYKRYGSLTETDGIVNALNDARRTLAAYEAWQEQGQASLKLHEERVWPLERQIAEARKLGSRRAYGIFGPKQLLPETQQHIARLERQIDDVKREIGSRYPPQAKFPYPNNREFYSDYGTTVSCLERRLEESRALDRSKEKKQSDRAQVAAAKGKTRDHANTLKKRLPVNHNCPYCNGPLGKEPHADHIYPVSKGGLSSPKNIVYVCAACNSKKGTLTLNQFIRKYGLNRDPIEARLSALGKEF